MSNDLIFYILAFAAILLVVFSFWLRLPSVVGRRGERRVSRVLSTLDPSRFKILNDILIGTPKGSSQIDHLVFSRCGIFTIETKNLRGWIHGNETSNTWTQTIYQSKHQFINPIRQNLSHVQALREVLKSSSHVPIYPIVVFAGSAELKNVNVTSPVIYVNELTSLVKRTGVEVLSNDQVENLFEQIQRSNLVGKEVRKFHISEVRKKAREVRKRTEDGVCPRCGGKLVLRNGSYGEFYGCDNYPRCRFTHTPEKGD